MSPLQKQAVSHFKSVKAPASTSTHKNSLYETPALGVFITRGGEIRSSVLAHETVRPIDSLATDLAELKRTKQELRVGTTPIRVLANTGGGDVADLLGLSAQLAGSLRILAKGIAAISVVGTAVTFVISALEVLGVFGEEENPYDELYGRIEQRLRHGLRATLAGQTLATMQQLSLLIGHSETAASIARAYRLNPTAAREAELPQANYWSQFALNTLRGEALWLRTYDEEAATLKPGAQTGWEFGPQVRPDSLMWDWRLPLLAYLKALAARIFIIHTIDPGVDAIHRAEILDQAKFLQTVEQRIRAGFSRALADNRHFEILAGDACGVIEVQSGEGDFTGSFMPAYWHRDEIETVYARTQPQPKTFEEYLQWHRNGVEERYWRLYDRLGLFSLWSIIPDVQRAARGLPGFGTTAKEELDGQTAAERPAGFGTTTKEVLNAFSLSALTESTGAAKLRLQAYTQWSEQAKAARKEQVEPAAINY